MFAIPHFKIEGFKDTKVSKILQIDTFLYGKYTDYVWKRERRSSQTPDNETICF